MKKLISILLVAMMLIVAVPVSAEGEATETTFVSGDNALLNDDYRFTYAEYRQDYKLPNAMTSKFVKFEKTGDGIEWSFDEEKTVKRLDFWVWPERAINKYSVQVYNAQNDRWDTVYGDEWNPDSLAIGSTTDNSRNTSWYSAVLNSGVATTKLRFVIDSFTDSEIGAYIAEANVGETNEIQLATKDTTNNDGLSHSIYVSHARHTSSSGLRKTQDSQSGYRSTGTNANTNWNSTYGYALYRVSFSVNTGTVYSFEVWCSNNEDDFSDSILSSLPSGTWKKVLTVNGAHKNKNVTYDIPDSNKAEYWMIRITEKASGTLNINGPAVFYELAENELNKTAFKGIPEAGNKVIFTLDKHENLKQNTTGKANIYFALYDGIKLISVTPVENVTLDSAINSLIYTVPTGATGDLSLRAFIWDGSENLKPLAGVADTSEE